MTFKNSPQHQEYKRAPFKQAAANRFGTDVSLQPFSLKGIAVRLCRLILVILLLPISMQAQADEKELSAAFKQGNWPIVKQETERLASAGNAWGLYMKAAFIGGILCQDATSPCKPIPGFEQDKKAAGQYLLAAAEKGERQAFDYLAFGYERGLWGLPVDRDAAIQWSLKGLHLMDERSTLRYYALTGLKRGSPLPGAHCGSRQ